VLPLDPHDPLPTSALDKVTMVVFDSSRSFSVYFGQVSRNASEAHLLGSTSVFFAVPAVTHAEELLNV
jgi:hypothetical protein